MHCLEYASLEAGGRGVTSFLALPEHSVTDHSLTPSSQVSCEGQEQTSEKLEIATELSVLFGGISVARGQH